MYSGLGEYRHGGGGGGSGGGSTFANGSHPLRWLTPVTLWAQYHLTEATQTWRNADASPQSCGRSEQAFALFVRLCITNKSEVFYFLLETGLESEGKRSWSSALALTLHHVQIGDALCVCVFWVGVFVYASVGGCPTSYFLFFFFGLQTSMLP